MQNMLGVIAISLTVLFYLEPCSSIGIKDLNYTNLIYQYFLVCGPDYLCDASSFNFTDVPHFNYSNLELCPMCNCDGKCVHREDCCPDIFFALPEQNCVNVTIVLAGRDRGRTEKSHYLMVDSCPVNSDSDVVQKCTESENLISRFQYLPVTSYSSHLSYFNKHCAQCNNDNNYTVWSIDIFCEEFSDFNFVSTFDELLSQAFDKRCIMQPFPESVDASTCFEEKIELFSFCNETRLWDKFDLDIKYGCESHYHGQFRMFKNIFCYMCNPSEYYGIAVDECNITGAWNPYDEGLKQGCMKFSSTEAIRPYKNVFCYLCNRDNSVRSSFVDAYANISEISGYRGPSGEVPVFWYNITMDNYNIQYFEHLVRTVAYYNPDVLKDVFVTYDRDIFEPVAGKIINTTSIIMQEFSLTKRVGLCDRNIITKEFWSFTRNCSCNPECFFNNRNGFCCDDLALRYPGVCLADRFVSRADNSKAEEAGKYIFVTSGCSSRSFPEMYKLGCENKLNDIFSILPVSDLKTNMLFTSFYCFLCNKIDLLNKSEDLDDQLEYNGSTVQNLHLNFDFVNLDPWDLEVKCFRYLDFSHFLLLGDLIKNIWQMPCNISYKPIPYSDKFPLHKKNMSFMVKECEPETYFDECNVTNLWQKYDFYISWACENISRGSLYRWLGYSNIANRQYKNKYCAICNPEVIKNEFIERCNVTGKWRKYSLQIDRACWYFPIIPYFSPYKNIFCALCNGVGLGMIGSGGPWIPPPYDDIYFKTMPWIPVFRNLFSINSYEVSSDRKGGNGCLTHQIFDKYKNVCRNITCYPGKFISNSSCKALFPITNNLRYTLAFKFNGSVESNITSVQLINGTVESVGFQIMTILNLRKNPITEFHLVTDQPCNSPIQNIRSTNYTGSMYLLLFIQEKVDRVLTEKNLVNMTRSKISHVYNGVHFQVNLNPSTNAFYLPLQRYRTTFQTKCFKYQFIGTDSTVPYRRYHSVFASDILTCSQVELQKDEIEHDTSKLRIRLSHAKSYLEYHRYDVMTDGMVRMCLDDFKIQSQLSAQSVQTGNKSSKEIYKLYLVNLFCTTASLLCILLTLATYCAFSVLRSTPGKTNMGLVCSLFVTILLNEIFIDKTAYKEFCVLLGILLHYFWLSSFLWMQMCSFHMYKIFRSKSHHSNQRRDKTFIMYCLYAFIIPLVVIIFNISIAIGVTKGEQTGYGEKNCFISERISYIMSFLVPVTLVCISNIYFFISTLITIKRVPKVESSKSNREEFQIYLKLFTVTGIAWVLQILDSMLPLSVFSYVVTVINGLQGVFIFLAFICNKRVLDLYKLKCGCTAQDNVKHAKYSKTTKVSVS